MGKAKLCYPSSWRTQAYERTHIIFKRNAGIYSLQVENGDIIKLIPSKNAKIVDKAPSGKMYLDAK